MPLFNISVGAIDRTFEAADEAAAILALVRDAGYESVEEAAEVCGQRVADFVDDISVTEWTE